LLSSKPPWLTIILIISIPLWITEPIPHHHQGQKGQEAQKGHNWKMRSHCYYQRRSELNWFRTIPYSSLWWWLCWTFRSYYQMVNIFVMYRIIVILTFIITVLKTDNQISFSKEF
jgi:hypothetical protein